MLAPERSLLHEPPCRLWPRMLSRPPSRDAYFDEEIELTERSPADAAKVFPSATDVRVQFLDELVEAEPRASRDPTEVVLGSAMRLIGNVEQEPPSPPAMLVAQEVEALVLNHQLHLGLLRIQREPHALQQGLHPLQRRIGLLRRQHHEVVRIADEPCACLAESFSSSEIPVEQVQVDVR